MTVLSPHELFSTQVHRQSDIPRSSSLKMDLVPPSNLPAIPNSTAKRNRVPLSCNPCRVRKYVVLY